MKKFLLLFSILFIISCNPSFEKDGGTRITLEVKNASKEQMDRTMLILAKRIDLFGILKPNIRIGNAPDRFVVELPGKIDNERILKVLQSSAKLEFWETYDNKEVYEKMTLLNTKLSEELYPELKDSTKDKETEIKEGASLNEQFAVQKSTKEIEEEKIAKIKKQNPLFAYLSPAYIYNGRQEVEGLAEGPLVGMAIVKDTAQVNKCFNSSAAKKIFGSYTKFLWTMQSSVNSESKYYSLIAIKVNRTGKAALWDNIVSDARVMYDDQSGSPQISLTMTQVAGFEWQKITRENIGKAIAIVIDNQVYSYPIVMSEIAGGAVSISGNFTTEEAQDFANVLKAGCLPVETKIVEVEVVAPKK